MSLSLSITDNGDATGGVATIAGSDSGSSNQVWVLSPLPMPPVARNAWSLGATRTGDGTVALPIAPGFYFAYCQGTVSSATAFSAVTGQFAITSGQTSVEEKLLDIVQSHIQVLTNTISGFPNPAPNPQLVMNETLLTFPCVVLTLAGVAEQALGLANNTDDWGRPVVVSIADIKAEEDTSKMMKYLYWRQCIMRQFHGQRPAGVPEGYYCQVEPMQIFDPRLPAYNHVVSAMVLRFKTREGRTP